MIRIEPGVTFRPADDGRDADALFAIWREAGWVREGYEDGARLALQCGRILVAELAGRVECMVQTLPAAVRYLDATLPMSYVAAVLTSRVARRRGLAARLTAKALAEDAQGGAIVAGLGAFDAGYYDRLGFGTMGYERFVAFDPASLRLRADARLPRRLAPDDWELIYASRAARLMGHGSVNVQSSQIIHAEMKETVNGFGMGYCDGPNGELTHHLWCEATDVERGPYSVKWMAYQNVQQLGELLALVRNLGDQVRLVRLVEPRGTQLQDLIQRPIRRRDTTRGTLNEASSTILAPYQFRMLDVAACMARTHLPNESLRFNLHLSDPIEPYLEPGAPWRGVRGDYVIHLGPDSTTALGENPSLPTLAASVGAFTRMWMGVLPATGLWLTDDVSGPPDLLARLDRALRLPEPRLDWEM